MKDAVGLEIGSTGVRSARVSLSRHPGLEAFYNAPLPQGAVKDGEIVDSALVEKAVSRAVKEVGKSKKVSIAVANQRMVARIAEIPRIEERDLRNAIRYQVQDLIPIPMEAAVLDFETIQEFINDDQEPMMRILVVAAYKDMINSFVEAISRAGLSPEVVDFAPLALMRSLGALQDQELSEDRDGEALIDVGTEVTSMVVRHKDAPKLARVLAVGGNEQPERLVEEIRGSIKFYMGQADGGAISRALLSGEAEGLEKVAPLLSDALNVPVEVGSCLGIVKSSKRIAQKMEAQNAGPVMAVAVGAALGALES